MESSYVDEREDVQKKTFAKWINSQLVKNNKPLVQDLFEDLRDGEVLLSLLEILTAQQYKRERGRMRVHQLHNVSTALEALREQGVRLVNIAAPDVLDCNHKLILGLVWSIIVHWQVSPALCEARGSGLERALLAWCRRNTANYPGVNITNFTSSWSDGLALAAILHRWRPALVDFEALARDAVADRLHTVFTLAEEHLGIHRLLDVEDVNTETPDKKSIMMYVLCLYQALPEHELPASPRTTEQAPSRPLSTATAASGELGGYGLALEEVLTWLLDAEETLAAAPAVADRLDEVKQAFHDHERFLVTLSQQQSGVGAALDAGSALLAGGALAADEAGEVRLQLRLLAARWDALRTAALQRQRDLQAALHRLQNENRDKF
ncbi:hypothetical protein JYU34_005490, partial [Plutella xylostella]